MRVVPAGGAALPRRQPVERGVVAAQQHRPAQRRSAGQTVDPRDGVAVRVVATAEPGHGVVEVGRPLGVDGDVRGLDRDQAERRLGDDAGETHAAGCCPEELGVVVGPDLVHALRRAQRDALHVVCEAAVDVMVLAVDVGRQRPAHGDVAGPGRDGDEPAAGHKQAQQGVEARARLDADHAPVEVEVEHPVERGGVDHGAAGVLGRIAVAASQAAGDRPAPARVLEDVLDVLDRVGRDDGRGRGRGAPPSRQQPSGLGCRGFSRHGLRWRSTPARPHRALGACGRAEPPLRARRRLPARR